MLAVRRLSALLAVACLVLSLALPARAGQSVNAAFTAPSINILPMLKFYESPQRQVQIELPPDAAGRTALMTLEARGNAPLHRWAVFTLANPGLASERLVLAVPHQKFAGSGVWWPRPPGSLVNVIQQSGGEPGAGLAMSGGDAFAFTVSPGLTMTVAMELSGQNPNQVKLWRRAAFDARRAGSSFFQGAIIGIVALLGLAIVCLFILRPAAVFAAAALFAWPGLVFLLAEFGALPDIAGLFPALPQAAMKFRVLIEALMLSGLVSIFITFSAVRRRLPLLGLVAIALAVGAAGLAVFGWFQPQIAAAAVRMAFAMTIVMGFVVLGVLAGRNASRVRASLLAWLVLATWTLAAAISCLGIVNADALDAGVAAGLALVILVVTIVAARFAFADLAGSRRDRAETSRRSLALSATEQSIWEWRPDAASLFVGPELERALGLETATLSGNEATWLEHVHPDDRAGHSGVMAAALARGRGSFNHEFRLRRADGTYRWYQLRGRAYEDDESAGRRLIGTLGDVTAWRRSEDRILSDAVRDRVTGLPNRALFIDRLERAMRRAANEDHHNLCVLAIDLDRFKSVNDGLGHEIGDSLLNIVGRRLSRLLGTEDTLARLPGDQFAIIFNGDKPARDVVAFADRVRGDISEPVNLRPREIFITATLGVAGYDGMAGTPEELLRHAEIALFEAKRRGKDIVEFFSPDMLHERSHLISLEQDLHRAMERGEIEVVYQPIMRLADGELAGFEALVRWRHPHHGLLEPDVFMGLAEETGIIRDLGRFVLDEALRQVGVWKRAFRPSDPLFVSVNVSFAQLLNYELVDEVRGLLAREGIPASTLKLEITESLVMENPELTGRVLQRINQLGVTMACDDFGTGYSSLANLHRLPFDTLKIDRSLIDASDTDGRAGVVLDAIVAMAHGLGLSIVAEGVETDAQMRRLMGLGCDLAQGYLVGRPVTARQIAEAFGGVAYVTGKGEGGFGGFWRRLIGGVGADGRDGRHPAFPDTGADTTAAPFGRADAAARDDGEELEPWAPPDDDVALPDLEARTRDEVDALAADDDADADVPIDVTGLLGGGNGSAREARDKAETEDEEPGLAGDGDGGELVRQEPAATGMSGIRDPGQPAPAGKPGHRLRRHTRGA